VIKRTDANHKEIIDAIRKIPALSVFSTHTIGKGFPDIVIGYKGINYLVEIKDGAKTKSQKKLTDDEIRFHQSWFGQIIVCECVKDVLQLLQINH
jgi:hypothetical protein